MAGACHQKGAAETLADSKLGVDRAWLCGWVFMACCPPGIVGNILPKS